MMKMNTGVAIHVTRAHRSCQRLTDGRGGCRQGELQDECMRALVDRVRLLPQHPASQAAQSVAGAKVGL
jgi:hypothetical protein